MATSIRRNLSVLIIGLIMCGIMISGIIMFYNGKYEAGEIFDGNIMQIAYAISAHSGDNRKISYDDKLKNEDEFLIQIWDETGGMVYSSHPNIAIPAHMVSGYGTLTFNGEIWRYYSLKADGEYVQVAQPVWFRNELMIEIMAGFIVPILIQLPFIIALIWFAIAKGTSPLVKLSEEIQQRQSLDLHEISMQKVPIEIAGLVGELNGLFGKLENAIKMQKDFTVDAAHELKTPLTAISLYGDMLGRESDREKQKVIIEDIRKAINRAAHLINQLLLLARSEAVNFAISNANKIDFIELVRQSVDERMVIAKGKRITLSLNIYDNEIKFNGSPEHLRLMVDNLVDNALRYTPEGGNVEVNISLKDDKICFWVADDGIGIPESEYENVFHRFYRVLGTKTSGSGLGLAIVKNVVDLHKALIKISKGIEGKGVCFTVIFNP